MFTTTVGTPYESHNLRRDFRRVTKAAGIGARWVPKELRTSFVSMMSYQGVPIEEIARLAGHASSRPTEVIYRTRIAPRNHDRSRGHGPDLPVKAAAGTYCNYRRMISRQKQYPGRHDNRVMLCTGTSLSGRRRDEHE